MYIRVKRFRNKDGSVREGGKVKQKVVAYLGRLDELQEEGTVDAMVEGLVRYAQRKEVIDATQDLFCESAKEYGPVLVFRKLWRDLGLEDFLTRYVAERGYEFPVVEAIFAMVANRLLYPCSKLAVSRWIEEVGSVLSGSGPGVLRHIQVSFQELVCDLGRMKAVELRVKDRLFRVRTELTGQAYQAFKAAGIAPPKRVLPLFVVGTSALDG